MGSSLSGEGKLVALVRAVVRAPDPGRKGKTVCSSEASGFGGTVGFWTQIIALVTYGLGGCGQL